MNKSDPWRKGAYLTGAISVRDDWGQLGKDRREPAWLYNRDMSDPFDFAEPNPSVPPTSPQAAAPYLDGLNEWQREAVEATDGALLVLAGAGTGKTRVLTTRLAHILIQGKAWPRELLAVTFTNKAAREMRERVADLLGREVEGWWVGTFHALGARSCAAMPRPVGLSSNFTILDDDDQLRLVKQLLEIHGIDEKKTPARVVLSVIQRWKDRGLLPAKVSGAEGSDACDGKALDLYGDYQARLQTLNACDFGDLLLHCLTLFQSDPEVLELPPPVPLHPGRRVPGHQRRPVPVAAAAGRQARATSAASATTTSRSIPGAGAEVGQYPALREGLSGRQGRPARAQLPFDFQYPRGRPPA